MIDVTRYERSIASDALYNKIPLGAIDVAFTGISARDKTNTLNQWFVDHLSYPYPTGVEKQMLCRQTGLQMTGVRPRPVPSSL